MPTHPVVLAAIALLMLSDATFAEDRPRNQIVVSPQGPRDGGDFGPHTPGTRTSGLQEALDAAKDQAKDVYIAGGSWTAGKNDPVVYNLHETLHVPWMQDFRLDSGHCVLNYTPTTGDAVVFDSQMSCAYRLGLIVSQSDGAVVRMRPATAGPDRFKVITSSEFTFNALVGGGGAWPGGEAHANELDAQHEWKGSGLWLDAEQGPIDGNKITVLETVGCNIGLLLTGAATRNTIEEINIHLCSNHVQIGGPRRRSAQRQPHRSFHGQPGDHAHERRTNLWLAQFADAQHAADVHQRGSGVRASAPRATWSSCTRPVVRPIVRRPVRTVCWPRRTWPLKVVRPCRHPATACENPYPFPVEVRIVMPGRVTRWSEQAAGQPLVEFAGDSRRGQSLVLNAGDRVQFEYEQPPTWRWKAIR